MKLPKDQPFWTSVILHLVVLLGLFLATIIQAFKPKEKPHVFEMVDPPSDVSQPSHSSQLPQPSVELPPVELPPVPQVDVPKPTPIPRSIDTRTPTPKPEPLISAADFFKNNPKPDPKPRPVVPRQNITVPQIDVPKLIIPQNPSNPSPQISQQQMAALADYSSRLRSRIDAAWIKPKHLAGVSLVAEVIFNVSASGQISNVRLSSSSGNSDLDQSILAAFRRATSAGPTPTGHEHQFSLPFRMRD